MIIPLLFYVYVLCKSRDIVEVRLDLAGFQCIVSDTAGLREDGADEIEIEGMKRAREAFKDAQIKIIVGI